MFLRAKVISTNSNILKPSEKLQGFKEVLHAKGETIHRRRYSSVMKHMKVTKIVDESKLSWGMVDEYLPAK